LLGLGFIDQDLEFEFKWEVRFKEGLDIVISGRQRSALSLAELQLLSCHYKSYHVTA